MLTASKRTVMVVVLLSAFAPVVSADPIQIVGGAFAFNRGTAVTVELIGGSDGFTYGGGLATPGVFGSFLPLVGDPVSPESTVNFLTRLGGSDIPGGTASFQGQTYRVGGLDAEAAGISTEWTGSLTLPSGFAGGTLTAPFAFTGNFAYPVPPFNFLNSVPLFGNGLASLTFGIHAGMPDHFILNAARLEFAAPSSDPVPEPASMLLGASGLAALLVRRRRSRKIA
jgi:MYXO-CTERM domain-containing protein